MPFVYYRNQPTHIYDVPGLRNNYRTLTIVMEIQTIDHSQFPLFSLSLFLCLSLSLCLRIVITSYAPLSQPAVLLPPCLS